MSIYTDPPKPFDPNSSVGQWLQNTGPPSSYEQWRDPYSINPPDIDPNRSFLQPTTDSPSASFVAPEPPKQAVQNLYAPPVRKENDIPEIRRPEYTATPIAEYQNWKQDRPLAVIEISPYQNRMREEAQREALLQQREMMYHPQYGWIRRGGAAPRVLPGRPMGVR